jgi:hypothetical protein
MLEGDNREKARAVGELQRTLEQEANRTRQRLADSTEDRNREVRDLEGRIRVTSSIQSIFLKECFMFYLQFCERSSLNTI